MQFKLIWELLLPLQMLYTDKLQTEKCSFSNCCSNSLTTRTFLLSNTWVACVSFLNTFLNIVNSIFFSTNPVKNLENETYKNKDATNREKKNTNSEMCKMCSSFLQPQHSCCVWGLRNYAKIHFISTKMMLSPMSV